MSFIGVATAVICHLMIYFFHNFWIILLSFILFGIGIGFAYYPILKTCWKYFPQKKGLISGIILCCFGFSPLVFTSLADFIINPHGEQTNDGYFGKEIADRMGTYALIMSIIMGISGFLAMILMFPLDDIETGEEKQKEVTEENEEKKSHNTIDNPSSNINHNEEEKDKIIETHPNSEVNEPFKQAALSLQFHLINLMSVGILFFGFFSTNTTRSFGSLNKIDETFLQTMSKVCALLNGFLRIGWGFIYDWYSFRFPYLVVCINQVLVSSTFYFCGQSKYAYFTANILENLTFSGHGTIIPPFITKKFGMKNAIKLIGITGYFIGTAGFAGALIAKFIIKKNEDFKIVYFIGAGLAVIGLIISIFIKDEKFLYKNDQCENTNKDISLNNKTCEDPLIKEKSIEFSQ